MWRLKNETVMRRFVEEVEKRANDKSTMDVEGAWGGLKSCLLEVSDKVCGKSSKAQGYLVVELRIGKGGG